MYKTLLFSLFLFGLLCQSCKNKKAPEPIYDGYKQTVLMDADTTILTESNVVAVDADRPTDCRVRVFEFSKEEANIARAKDIIENFNISLLPTKDLVYKVFFQSNGQNYSNFDAEGKLRIRTNPELITVVVIDGNTRKFAIVTNGKEVKASEL